MGCRVGVQAKAYVLSAPPATLHPSLLALFTLKPATGADFATIRDIAHRTWPVTFADILSPEQMAYMLDMMYSEAALREQTGARGHRFLLAEDAGGEPTGYASFELHYRPRTTKLHKLYVLPEAQGRGVGQTLTAAVERAAREGGDEVLRLDVNRDNRAVGFYERAGFTKVAEAVTDIGRGYVMDDFVYERPVPALTSVPPLTPPRTASR